MNVLLTDIKDQPNRPPAAPAYNERISEEINKNATDDRYIPSTEKAKKELGLRINYGLKESILMSIGKD